MGQLHPAGGHKLAQARVVACDTSSEVNRVGGGGEQQQAGSSPKAWNERNGFAPLGLQASGYCVLRNDVECVEDCGAAIPGKKLLRVRFISRARQGKQAPVQEAAKSSFNSRARQGWQEIWTQGLGLTPSAARKRTCNASDAVQQGRGAGVGRHCAAGCRLVSAKKVV